MDVATSTFLDDFLSTSEGEFHALLLDSATTHRVRVQPRPQEAIMATPATRSALAQLATIAVTIGLVSGCALFKDAYRVDPVVIDSRPSFNRKAEECGTLNFFRQTYRTLSGTPAMQQIVLNEYVFAEDDPHPPTTTTTTPPSDVRNEAPRTTTTPTPPEETFAVDGACLSEPALAYEKARHCKADRNRLAQKIVALSNDMCVLHMSGFVSQQALNELTLGSVALGLTAAGSVVGAAAALSAAATGIAGTRTLLNDSVYYKQLTPALVKAAFAERARVLTVIAAKLQVNSLDEDDLEKERLHCSAACLVPDVKNAETPAAPGPPIQPNTKPKPKPKVAPRPDPDHVAECRARCNATKLFPCPGEYQLDVQKTIAEANDAWEKVQKANEGVIKAVNDKDKKKAEKAIRDRQQAEDDFFEKQASSENASKEANCRDWHAYAIDDVIADLKQFHDACSFYHTLASAVEQIQKQSEKITGELDKIYDNAKKDAVKGNKPATAGEDDQQHAKPGGAGGSKKDGGQ
jgi:hypothetical protein